MTQERWVRYDDHQAHMQRLTDEIAEAAKADSQILKEAIDLLHECEQELLRKQSLNLYRRIGEWLRERKLDNR